jgi:monofunctional biosynthetic peptidoglycan transglycosylase
MIRESMIAPPYEPPRKGRVRRTVYALLAAFALYLVWQAVTWPNVGALVHEHPKTTAFIERYRGHGWLGPRRPVEWTWVSGSRISPSLKRAVIVSEDIEFFSHNGFSTREQRAALEDAWEDKTLPRGASTITQQLAKNLWLSPSYNPLRKVKEAILTWQLEQTLSKRRILELYLNVAELGEGIYGAEAAARHYYGVSAAGLSERQAAELAASLPRPKSWHPGSKSKAYQRKVRIVQRRMARASWLRRQV